jgi:hypothetical protein
MSPLSRSDGGTEYITPYHHYLPGKKEEKKAENKNNFIQTSPRGLSGMILFPFKHLTNCIQIDFVVAIIVVSTSFLLPITVTET